MTYVKPKKSHPWRQRDVRHPMAPFKEKRAVINKATEKEYGSIMEAAHAHNGSHNALSEALKRGHRFKGYYWGYKNED